MLSIIRNIRELHAESNTLLVPVLDTYSLLLKYDACPIARVETEQLAVLKHQWADVKNAAEDKASQIAALQVSTHSMC